MKRAGLVVVVTSVMVSSVLVAARASFPEETATVDVIPGGTLSRIQAGAPLRVCADPDNLPFSSKAGEVPGFEVELARAVATALGTKESFVWLITGWARRALSRLAEGECDIFLGLPIDPRFAKENPKLIFSEPYYTMRHALVVPEGNPLRSAGELGGRKVSVEVGSIADYYLAERGGTRKPYRRGHEADAFKALSTGEADAALMWATVAGWMARTHPGLRVRLIGIDGPGMQFQVGVAMRRRDTDLRAATNRALRRLGEGTVKEIVDRYVLPLTSMSAGEETRPARAGEVTGVVAEVQDKTAGRELFDRCAQCHGLHARGGGLVPSLKDFKGTEEEFVKAVLNGRPGTAMRPWKGLLNGEQIRAIRSYIKNLPD